MALGVAFFVAVSSLMRGSEADFIKRLIDSAPHITVSDEFRTPPEQPVVTAYAGGAVVLRSLKPKTETRGIRGYKQKLAFIANLPGVRVAPVLSGQAILTFAGKEQGITLNGILPEMMAGVSDIDDKIVAGSLDAVAQTRTASSSAAAWRGSCISTWATTSPCRRRQARCAP